MSSTQSLAPWYVTSRLIPGVQSQCTIEAYAAVSLNLGLHVSTSLIMFIPLISGWAEQNTVNGVGFLGTVLCLADKSMDWLVSSYRSNVVPHEL